MPLPIRLSGIWLRLIPVGRLSSDKLGSKISNAIQNPGEQRDRFTEGLYIPRDPSEALGELEDAFDAVTATVPLVKKVQSAIRAKTLPKKPVELLVDEAVSKGVLTSEEGNKLRDAEAKRLDAIQVDSFDATEYRAYGFPETKATVTG